MHLETSASGSTVPKVALHRKRNVIITFLIDTWKQLFLTMNANAIKMLHRDKIDPIQFVQSHGKKRNTVIVTIKKKKLC